MKTTGSYTGSGKVALWTPAAGYSVRAMGIKCCFSKEATTASQIQLLLYDNLNIIANITVSNVAMTAPGIPIQYDFQFQQNGLLLQPNDVLYVSLSNSLTAGAFSAMAWGTEE